MISLKDLAIRGTAWTVLGYGSSQLLRLGSNLVLTRILAPEIFGIMALVNVLLVGLNMFSDIGIGPNIIQSDRGDNPEFLHTAWTLQIIRGFGIWICACIGAWPFSRFYGEPQLAWIIPIVSLGAAISGYNSTGIFTANRHLKFHRITLIELGSQCLAIAVMVVWAAITPTVWALVAGSLIGATLKMVASHIWLSNIPHKWMRKWDEIKSITRFGRWIFISTILGFLVNSGDRLILGKFLSLEALGIYSIAFMIANFFRQIHEQDSSKILFPLYGKLGLGPKFGQRDTDFIRISRSFLRCLRGML